MGKAHVDDEVIASHVTVGRYRLLMPLGGGGAATVYLARTTGIGGFARDVAVKVLHPHLRYDKAYVADFLREARLAANLRHPNLLPVLDVGDTAAGVFLVMDWVDGCSLSELLSHIQGKPMPLPVAMRIMVDGLAGLHAAHELCDEQGRSLGLVHRDVSPHNLLLSAAGATLLSDFGIAKPTTQASHTRTGVIKGKLGYMAPEQLGGGVVDRRTDVWSAGITCWETLVGRRPFSSEDEAQLILDVTAGRVPDLLTARPDLPRELVHAVEGALTVRADDRWSSADVFRKRLIDASSVCGGLADLDQISQFVMSVMGDVIEARRERVRGTRQMTEEGVAVAQRPRSRAWLWGLGALLVTGAGASAVYLSVKPTQPMINRPEPRLPTLSNPDKPAAAPVVSPQTARVPRTMPKQGAPRETSRAARRKFDVPPLADNPYTKP